MQPRGICTTRAWRAVPASCVCLAGLGGCRLAGAPSFDMFGAHFPAWLLCAGLGIVAAFVFRAVMIAVGFDDVMPLRLLTYTALGVGSASWLWLTLFGER